MVAGEAAAASPQTPRLAPALAAMTGLQALVALALFAPGVLAPKFGISERDISLFTTSVFVVGVATSMAGGMLAARLGSLSVAALCALAVAAAMTTAMHGSSAALIAAGAILGLAFGPETPASSALLARLSRPEQRPLIFSIRQTGNQLGAMLGSLTLPAIAVLAPDAGFAVIALLSVLMCVVFLAMRPRYDTGHTGAAARISLQQSWHLLRAVPALSLLALVSMPFSAMQLALNAYFVILAVDRLALPHVTAGVLLAVAQAGGLIGRLLWGMVATRYHSARAVVAGLGFAMSACAAAVSIASPSWPLVALGALAFVFGLTASGWNGVFLAEVARLAPEGRVPEATGAVLTASYAGLLLGPLLMAGVAQVASIQQGYAVLAALALLATVALRRAPP
ncbi:MAG: MFS transporter [Hyphomicrobiaceae bacterium]